MKENHLSSRIYSRIIRSKANTFEVGKDGRVKVGIAWRIHILFKNTLYSVRMGYRAHKMYVDCGIVLEKKRKKSFPQKLAD